MKRGKWAESPSACTPHKRHTETVFESLFQRSADAIWLYDPQKVACFRTATGRRSS